MDVLKLKKAWEVALAPVKQLPMTAFMMYMSGNTMQIFSIMMVVMAFKTPIMGLLTINQAFGKFESDGIKSQLVMVKGVYILMQILALCLGIWKVDRMGLLPSVLYLNRESKAYGFQNNEIRLVSMGSSKRPLRSCIPCVLNSSNSLYLVTLIMCCKPAHTYTMDRQFCDRMRQLRLHKCLSQRAQG